MATVRLYLDDRKENKTKEYPLVILLSNKNTTSHIPLNIKLRSDQWEDMKVVNHEQKKYLNNLIPLKFSEINIKLMELESTGKLKGKTASEIKKLILTATEEKPAKDTSLFKDYYKVFISRKNKKSTIETYNYSYNRLCEYTDINILKFSDINVAFLRQYEMELAKTCSVNSRSIHFRNLRSVFNAAINEDIIPQDCYPFRRFRIKNEATEKRSLTVEELRKLRDYPCEEHQKKYRDIFMLSFYLAGINMIDLINMPLSEQEGIIRYKRSKTGIYTQINIPTEAAKIIEKYKGNKHLLWIAEKYANHKDFIHRMNQNLQRIGESSCKEIVDKGKLKKEKVYNGIFPNLTTYWARHTWATIAADLDIPDAIIDMSLAHKSMYPMSDIYIRRNLKKVNEAVQKVIEHVNKKSSKD